MSPRSIRNRIHEIIFEADTKMGRFFDLVLLVLISLSVIVVLLESVESIDNQYHEIFFWIEWILTILFTIEYLLRIYVTLRPQKYITSFYGVVDLLSILPTYISLFIAGSQSLLVIRGLRLLRIFRILKLTKFTTQGQVIMTALNRSRGKIVMFFITVILIVTIIGAAMYLIEGGANPRFDNIPRSIYWAIVTLTTVGYGDITPVTSLGQLVSAFVMILGYAIIAVPTGIVTNEIINEQRNRSLIKSTQACRYCSKEGHDLDAKFCKYCGELINIED